MLCVDYLGANIEKNSWVIPRQIAQKKALLGPTPFDFLEIWWADSTYEVMHFHSFLALGDLRGQF